ncbi:hypothetical protein TPR58_19830 [Sphingomonas sp. HF-S3]|uniref:Uncharacterized protein n=1 Tax=Sphingomonas rustica TaxID=3103142 RepID=A0ABV0BD15_9SPHN
MSWLGDIVGQLIGEAIVELFKGKRGKRRPAGRGGPSEAILRQGRRKRTKKSAR